MQGIFHRRDCMGCTRSKIAIDLTTLMLELLKLPLSDKHFHPLSNNQNQEDMTRHDIRARKTSSGPVVPGKTTHGDGFGG